MVDIGGDDRPAARHFVSNKFRGHELGNRRAETVSSGGSRVAIGAIFQGRATANVLANRDVLHLRGDNAFSRVVHLGNVTAGLGAQNRTPGSFGEGFGVRTLLAIAVNIAARHFLHIAPSFDPLEAHRSETRPDIGCYARSGVWPGCVVNHNGIILVTVTRMAARQSNRSHRDTDVGMFMAMNVRLLRSRKRLSGYSVTLRLVLFIGVRHFHPPLDADFPELLNMTVRFDVFFVEPLFSLCCQFTRSFHQHFFVLDKILTTKTKVAWMRSRIHSNRITGTRLDAKTAIDAAQGVDLVSDRVFFNRIVRILTGLDINALSRTGSRAQKTSRALNRAVIFQGQAVPTPKSVRIRGSFIRILDGNRRLKFPG